MLTVSSLSAWERDLFELQLVLVGQGLSQPVGLAEGIVALWVRLPHQVWIYTSQRSIAELAALRLHVGGRTAGCFVEQSAD